MTSRSRPSQRDVAARAGVSRTAVSFVLNDVPDVAIPEATRARILAAAEELGFRPNELARSLRSSRSTVLGLITSEIATTPYAVAIIKGAQQAAAARGRTLLIVDTDGTAGPTTEALLAMSSWRAEGLIFATDYHREVQLPEDLGGIPVVLVNCFSPAHDGPSAAPAVVPDERQGGRLATRTLLDAGHRRIALINGPDGFPASAGRLRGYLDAHAEAGVPVPPGLVRTGDWWQESGALHTADLLSSAEPPTALFCANDWMAMGAYDVVKERHLRIPEDVAIVGFDNREEIAAHMRPGLTTVALPYYDLGRRGVELLLADPTPRPILELLACPLIRRSSV
jgi:LacI family transcriptional regulator